MNKDDYNKDTGAFLGDNDHKFDEAVFTAIKDLCKKNNIKEIYDFGCGWTAKYTIAFNDNGITCEGWDGNPLIEKQKKPYLKCMDLTEGHDIEYRGLVLSLEVGEHIPKKHEDTYINNICHASSDYVILSWALPNQGGLGHVNEQTKSYIREKMSKNNFSTDWKLEKDILKVATLGYFKKTIMVFRRCR